MKSFPIDEILPDLVSALESNSTLVLHAPPGAGKTTRVPLALLEASFLEGKRMIMLEPRRLAAANAARWMARQLGEEPGQRVGYRIRFEQRVSSATRIEVVTEGILTRRLQIDPFLEGVGLVIFDEFHERSLHADLALALCRDAQLGLREDLKILVMSATLDVEPVARLLGNAPVIASQGRNYPVEIRYQPQPEDAKVAEASACGIMTAVRETTGDILVFLPGVPEIRRCQSLLSEAGGELPMVCPLYGDLPFEQQELAILPAERRKIVLATNIAETSLTIEGVSVVIDSGWSRQSRFDPASGMDRLVTVRVSKASADQRAGRAGRLGPGVCYRLWSEHTQNTLVPFSSSEIAVSDLAPLVLQLAHWGVTEPNSLSWLDSPPAAAVAEAKKLLTLLGALDIQGKITGIGKRMALLPAHPRIAHLLLKGEEQGTGSLACEIGALLSERDILRNLPLQERVSSDNDIVDRLEALRAWRQGRGIPASADRAACRTVEKSAGHFRKLLGVQGETQPDPEMTSRLLAAAYPDRIGKRREPGGDRYLLANGKGVALSRRTAVRDGAYIVAVDVEGGDRGEGLVHIAAVIAEEVIRRDFGDLIEGRRDVFWDVQEGRIVSRMEERLGAIVLKSRPIKPSEDEVVAALIEGLRGPGGPGLSAFNWTEAPRQLRLRVHFLSKTAPEQDWPDLSDRWLLQHPDRWLTSLLTGTRSLQDLSRIDLVSALKSLLTWEQQRKLEEGAPTHMTVPSGSRIAVEYTADGPPVLAVKLQELFGLAETPRVAWGRVPVLLHLLSPARRPIQVTQDLKGFWNGAYQEVKKELKGRYPKHPWPDDPWTAVPTKKTKRQF